MRNGRYAYVCRLQFAPDCVPGHSVNGGRKESADHQRAARDRLSQCGSAPLRRHYCDPDWNLADPIADLGQTCSHSEVGSLEDLEPGCRAQFGIWAIINLNRGRNLVVLICSRVR
jgi:hypothetical protein